LQLQLQRSTGHRNCNAAQTAETAQHILLQLQLQLAIFGQTSFMEHGYNVF